MEAENELLYRVIYTIFLNLYRSSRVSLFLNNKQTTCIVCFIVIMYNMDFYTEYVYSLGLIRCSILLNTACEYR